MEQVNNTIIIVIIIIIIITVLGNLIIAFSF